MKCRKSRKSLLLAALLSLGIAIAPAAAAKAQEAAADAGTAQAASSASQDTAQDDAGDTQAAKSGGQDASAAAQAPVQVTTTAAKDTKKAKRERKAKAPKERYVCAVTDNGYRYDIDTKNLRWIPLPHSGDEYILDVWVKLSQEQANDGSDGTYTYPEKYYLTHYYVRPKTHQIQFLAELEVTGGRPDNTIKGRGYQAQNWEDLTPDSIEDEIYTCAVKNAGKNKLSGASSGGMNIRDAVEEYLRISL